MAAQAQALVLGATLDHYQADPVRGYGPGMHRLLGDVLQGAPWQHAVRELFAGQGSFGNGAAMRAPVIGAWFADNIDQVVEQARRSAEVTHRHPEGVGGAVAVAAAIACHADCPPGIGFIDRTLVHIPGGALRDRVARALDLPADTPIQDAVALLGNGERVSAQDTVPLVL